MSTDLTPASWHYDHARCGRFGWHDPHVWFVNGSTLSPLIHGRWCNG